MEEKEKNNSSKESKIEPALQGSNQRIDIAAEIRKNLAKIK
jgi:hypothetical protein